MTDVVVYRATAAGVTAAAAAAEAGATTVLVEPGRRNHVGHVEPAIRCCSVAKGFGKIGDGRLPARAHELHAAASPSLTAITFTPSDATGAR